MGKMRVAHFSDLHLLALDGVRFRDFLNKRWIGGLNLLANRTRHHDSKIFEALVQDLNQVGVDHAICTGDLTNLALESEFRLARSYFDGIALGTDNVTVIPGNHDAYVRSGLAHFHTLFADYCCSDTDGAWTWPSKRGDDPTRIWPIVRVRGPIAIIGLRSSKQTPWFTAYGRLEKIQLERLYNILTSEQMADKLRIIAIHHPPAGPESKRRGRGLRDHAALAAVLAETGAELVIHGHEHRDLRYQLYGHNGMPIPVMGIQSGTYYSHHQTDGDRQDLVDQRCARYRIFDIEPEPQDGARPILRAHTTRVYDRHDHTFVAEGD